MAKKILVALDGSAAAYKALTKAISMAAEKDSKLYLLHVVQESIVPHIRITEKEQDVSAIREKTKEILMRDAQLLFEAVSRECETAKIPYEKLLAVGQTQEQILQAIETISPDAVVFGSHGYRNQMDCNSLSFRIKSQVKCPVIVA